MKYTSNVTMFGWSRDAVNCHWRSTSSAVWPVIHILLRACRIKRSLPSVRPSSMTVRNTSRFQNISFRFQLKFSSLIRYSGWSQIVHVTYAACHLFLALTITADTLFFDEPSGARGVVDRGCQAVTLQVTFLRIHSWRQRVILI